MNEKPKEIEDNHRILKIKTYLWNFFLYLLNV